jgi:hypothetical protein
VWLSDHPVARYCLHGLPLLSLLACGWVIENMIQYEEIAGRTAIGILIAWPTLFLLHRLILGYETARLGRPGRTSRGHV